MAPRSPQAGAGLIVWRHGATEANDIGVMPGQLDFALTSGGRDAARSAAIALALLRPRAVLSSDLVRAKDTAAQLCALTRLPLRSDGRLREVDLGRWAGLTRAQAQERFPAEYQAWHDGADVRRGGGETLAEAGERARQCIAEASLTYRGEGPLVAVTHAGVARALVLALLEIPMAYWSRLAPLKNCCWTVLGQDFAGWQMIAHNCEAPFVACDAEMAMRR